MRIYLNGIPRTPSVKLRPNLETYRARLSAAEYFSLATMLGFSLPGVIVGDALKRPRPLVDVRLEFGDPSDQFVLSLATPVLYVAGEPILDFAIPDSTREVTDIYGSATWEVQLGAETYYTSEMPDWTVDDYVVWTTFLGREISLLEGIDESQGMYFLALDYQILPEPYGYLEAAPWSVLLPQARERVAAYVSSLASLIPPVQIGPGRSRFEHILGDL